MTSPPDATDWVAELTGIMARLRAPDGCPWDREQDHRTLTTYLVEEAHEFIDAVLHGSDDEMADELGDLLLQVVFHCQIASESQRFDLQQVARKICEKMIRRHPHVFASGKADTPDAVVAKWQEIKAAEPGRKKGDSVLDDVPGSFPALLHAQKISKRAAVTGFDWPDHQGPREKVLEELAEIDAAESREELESEIGDLLFAAVNLARKHGIDAETALRQATAKFENRFRCIEREYADRDVDLRQSPQPLEDLDAAWDRAKHATETASPKT